MERHLKGIANHRRVEILLCIAKNDGVTLEDIIGLINANEKTVGEHTRRLHVAGLIEKTYRGRYMKHSLSPYGKLFVKFLQTFQTI